MHAFSRCCRHENLPLITLLLVICSPSLCLFVFQSAGLFTSPLMFGDCSDIIFTMSAANFAAILVLMMYVRLLCADDGTCVASKFDSFITNLCILQNVRVHQWTLDLQRAHLRRHGLHIAWRFHHGICDRWHLPVVLDLYWLS